VVISPALALRAAVCRSFGVGFIVFVGGKAILWGGKENCLSFKYSGIFSCIFVMNAVYYIKMVIGTGFGQFRLVTFVVKLGDIVC